MINLTNNGKTVTVKNSANGEYKIITLNRGITLKPREKFIIKTGVEIECTSQFDECWIYSDPIFDKAGDEVDFSDNIGIVTHRITKDNGKYELVLIGGYMGDEDVKLPKDAEIANIYFSISNPYQQELDTDYNTLYDSDGVKVKTARDFFGQYEIILEPDGEKYLKVHLPS